MPDVGLDQQSCCMGIGIDERVPRPVHAVAQQSNGKSPCMEAVYNMSNASERQRTC